MTEINLKSRVAIPAIICYPELSTPDRNGNFQALFLVDNDAPELASLKALLKAHCQAAFASDQLPSNVNGPLREANETKEDGEFAFKHKAFRTGSKIVFRAKSKYDVACFATPRQTPCDPADIHGGDEVYVEVGAYNWSRQGNKGISLSLSSVWLINPCDSGDRIERGAGGSAFASIDPSTMNFKVPGLSSDSAESSNEGSPSPTAF